MRIRLLAFASAADILGSGQSTLDLPDGTRLIDLKRHLESAHPELAPLWDRLALAVDGELVADTSVLEEGAEVALLPPVSGGVGPGVGERARLTSEPLDAERITARVTSPGRGAVLVFLGTVRDHHAGRPVERLTYSAYRPMAERRLATIVSELEAAGEELGVAIVHRLGEVPAGEASVVIAVASPHREAAYRASRRALERLKAEVPIWKREHYADGEARWREEEPLREPVPDGTGLG